MTVKQLIKKLQSEVRHGNGDLEVRQFAGDHNPEMHDEGTGPTFVVGIYTNDIGETFLGLRT